MTINTSKAPFDCLNEEPEEIKYWFVQSKTGDMFTVIVETVYTDENCAMQEYFDQVDDSKTFPGSLTNIQLPKQYTKKELYSILDSRVIGVDVEDSNGNIIEQWQVPNAS